MYKIRNPWIVFLRSSEGQGKCHLDTPAGPLNACASESQPFTGHSIEDLLHAPGEFMLSLIYSYSKQDLYETNQEASAPVRHTSVPDSVSPVFRLQPPTPPFEANECAGGQHFARSHAAQFQLHSRAWESLQSSLCASSLLVAAPVALSCLEKSSVKMLSWSAVLLLSLAPSAWAVPSAEPSYDPTAEPSSYPTCKCGWRQCPREARQPLMMDTSSQRNPR
eukprot:scaffold10_cov257-Pinguiococcus_pyrenoidosus.AAC.64